MDGRSIGMEPDSLSTREKWLLILRMVPLVENNYNLCELGPRSTGKSHLFKEISPNSILVSGGQTTVTNLFYNMGRKTVGLVGLWDCVAFDEVAGIRFKDKDGVQIMKDYMASGSFARGKEEKAAFASMVFVGNINQSVDVLLKTSSLFDPFPPEMGTDTAFLDRIHCYLPGWEVPKFRPEHFTDDYGFITDYRFRALLVFCISNRLCRAISLYERKELLCDGDCQTALVGFLTITKRNQQSTRNELFFSFSNVSHEGFDEPILIKIIQHERKHGRGRVACSVKPLAIPIFRAGKRLLFVGIGVVLQGVFKEKRSRFPFRCTTRKNEGSPGGIELLQELAQSDLHASTPSLLLSGCVGKVSASVGSMSALSSGTRSPLTIILKS